MATPTWLGGGAFGHARGVPDDASPRAANDPAGARPTTATAGQQRRIREKLADGILPRALGARVPILGGGPSSGMAGRPRVAPCDACDEVGMTRPIAGLLWHEGCYVFWRVQTEREA
jgi:hypothetical protein